ncbi:MAG TPA: magnesium transporter CorA family protein [Actinomycetota bacterium]|nr:magnesium transporter CorA family protein [Actinomycetota bacterium]
MIRTRIYRKGQLLEENPDPALISDYLLSAENCVWLDLVEPTAGELNLFQEEFGLHPLAIEDAVHAHQRPKVDRYRHHLFAAVYAAWLDQTDETHAAEGGDGHRHVELETAEVDVFVGQRYLITVRKDPRWDMEPVLRRWEKGETLLEYGVSFMLHGLLDQIVDEYGVVTEALDDRLDEVEDTLLGQNGMEDFQGDLLELRRAVVGLRKIVLPLRESFGVLMEGPILDISEEMRPYFGDVKDHVLRVASDLDTVQELLLNAIQLNMSMASNRLNVIMKQLTSWAAIIGANTVVAGVYGMNYRLWPHNDNELGFWVAIGVMFASSITIYLYFRQKDWL